MRKNLQHIKLGNNFESGLSNRETENFFTAEGIELKSRYSKQDIDNLEHLDFGAGFAPNLRGLQTTMYVRQPWEIRHYTEFSTNKKNLVSGQKGLSIVFNLPTNCDYESNDEGLINNVEKAGITIDSVEDIKLLLEEITLDQISVNLKINVSMLAIMAFYIVAAEEQGISTDQLSVTIQDDILKELIEGNTYRDPSVPSMKMIADIFEFASKKMPKFKSISISGYSIQEAGATADIDLAYTLCYGLDYIRAGLESGIKIDNFAPRLSFLWGIGMNHFMEIAKLRAGRMLWAKLIKQFNPQDDKSLALQTHCQTSSCSLTPQDSFNNLTRTTVEAAAAIFGGTASLHTNTFNKSFSLTNDFSNRIALNTQYYLQEETKITKTVDPWAGSFYIESLTNEMAQKTWQLIDEVEKLGGMTKAIETGIPKLRIEEAAAKKKTQIDSNQNIIVGVNKYCSEKEIPTANANSVNQQIYQYQIEKLKQIKANRNTKKVKQTIDNLILCAQNGQGNLLELAIEAARNRATLGEISIALKTVSKI